MHHVYLTKDSVIWGSFVRSYYAISCAFANTTQCAYFSWWYFVYAATWVHLVFAFFYNKATLRALIAATGLVILDSNRWLISSCNFSNLMNDLKNNKALLLYYIKLCASFQIHRWIQTGVTVRKYSIQVRIADFLSCVTLKFYGWPWKTIGHLFYTTSSFVQHFKAISILKLELQSGKIQFASKLAMFFVPLETRRMTLKNNRTSLLYYVKRFVQHFKAIGIFKLELQSGNVQCGSKLPTYAIHPAYA